MTSKLRLFKEYKFYIITILLALVVSNLLAYKFKKLSSYYYLNKALKKKTEWGYNAYLEMINSKYSFFHLTTVFEDGRTEEVFSYNWEVFLISMALFLGVTIFIRNTIYYDTISQFFRGIKK